MKLSIYHFYRHVLNLLSIVLFLKCGGSIADIQRLLKVFYKCVT